MNRIIELIKVREYKDFNKKSLTNKKVKDTEIYKKFYN